MERAATSKLRLAPDHSFRAMADQMVACRRGWSEPVLTVGQPGSALMETLFRNGPMLLADLAASLPAETTIDELVEALAEAGLVEWERDEEG
jgi:hypothetical protein